MDKIYIKKLTAETLIGIYDWELEVRQKVCIDLEMGVDLQQVLATENLDDSLDYRLISDRIIELVEASEYPLIELLAERIAELLMTEFDVRWLRLRLTKPDAVPEALAVGVEIERGEHF